MLLFVSLLRCRLVTERHKGSPAKPAGYVGGFGAWAGKLVRRKRETTSNELKQFYEFFQGHLDITKNGTK